MKKRQRAGDAPCDAPNEYRRFIKTLGERALTYGCAYSVLKDNVVQFAGALTHVVSCMGQKKTCGAPG
jgi:hypothetical protein